MAKTSKVIENAFDLGPNPDNEIVYDKKPLAELMTPSILDELDKIDAALPLVRGLETSETELDELAVLAIQAFKDLHEMAFNVDAKDVAEISTAAATYLGHAVTARKNKIEKKLKMVELQIKKLRVDQNTRIANDNPANAILGEAVNIDRNALLDRMIKDNKDAVDKQKS